MKGTSVVVLVGLVVVLAGLAMPSTQTNTVEGCVEGERAVSGDGYCSGIESSAEVTTPNPAKAPTIGFGFLLVLVGGAMSYSAGRSGGRSDDRSDTVLRVSGEVVDRDTGETTTLALPVHTDSVDAATRRFESRCRSEGYDVAGDPSVDVESKSDNSPGPEPARVADGTGESGNLVVRRWRAADGVLEKAYLAVVGLLIFWGGLVVVLAILGSVA
ncbi:hypothetical protein M0R89_02565 [Halorussus limi]|uniref:Uncharacterized protein n=1 Tax=Halorussus limi TaxID=2938695 RepID=A0A8U0HVJ6_9EURY|nr:hypothetical protein [Halorussus limi]UPV74958.1 hypothetical protein M0R89_02565 [Halorussus limi]